MCTIGPRRFTGLLADFNMLHSGVLLQLIEGVPARLAELLEAGEIDVAIMASNEQFPDRFNVVPLYRERFVIACPSGHRLLSNPVIRMRDLDGENYLRRVNCEFREQLGHLCAEQGAKLNISYSSEREDWIQNMVAGGLGICFIPEYSAIIPGLQVRPVVEPEVWREVCLVTVAGRRFSPAVATFVNAVKSYNWASGTPISMASSKAA
jgi:DNA-binding transcriptional LysR family regulator